MIWRDLVPLILFLHVLAAIVAIGPNFACSTIRALGQQPSSRSSETRNFWRARRAAVQTHGNEGVDARIAALRAA